MTGIIQGDYPGLALKSSLRPAKTEPGIGSVRDTSVPNICRSRALPSKGTIND